MPITNTKINKNENLVFILFTQTLKFTFERNKIFYLS